MKYDLRVCEAKERKTIIDNTPQFDSKIKPTRKSRHIERGTLSWASFLSLWHEYIIGIFLQIYAGIRYRINLWFHTGEYFRIGIATCLN